MKEDFVHFIWKSRSIPLTRLETTDGGSVQVLKWGFHNHDAGPDFLQSEIIIDGQKWAGNVEMHLRSSDWNRHQHHLDPVYNSVILHVVWEHDAEVKTEDGLVIPTLSLKSIVVPSLHERYLQLLTSPAKLPCEEYVDLISDIKLSSWFQRLFIERIEHKKAAIMDLVQGTKGDWEVAFILHLARSFGLHKNQLGFQMLVRSIPHKVLMKYASDRFRLEALLYGQSGFLHGQVKDHYPRGLLKEYRYLRWKYKLSPIDKRVWKLLRMRPAGFPTVRISQFAGLLEDGLPLLRRFCECSSVSDLHSILNQKSTGYWKSHYLFDRPSAVSTKRLGKSFREIILINSVLPFLYSYSEAMGHDDLRRKVLDWIYQLPPEQNKLLRQWKERTDVIDTAAHAQGVLQLHKNYCTPRRCVECTIGCYALTQIYTVSEEEDYYLLPT